MNIRFDAERAERAFHKALLAAMKQLQGELLRDAQNGMRTPEGRESLYAGDIEAVAGIITADVIGGAWAAMDEWGRGSLMDMSNPALDDYMQSELWNEYRGNDPTIRSRARGPYKNIFGKTVVSRSNKPGINLEVKGGKFAPQPPSHALRDATRWMANGRFREVLTNLLATFPWGDYIVTGR